MPGVLFRDVTAAAGLGDFVHVNGSFGQKLLPETMGSGIGLADFDADGDLDVVALSGRRWTGHTESYPSQPGPPESLSLYQNLGALRFERVVREPALPPRFEMGCALADYDADGDEDLFVTAVDGNRLLRNDGDWHFEDVTEAAGLTSPTWSSPGGELSPSWSTGAAWLDADGDGDLDLYVASYIRWSEPTDIFASLIPGRKAFTTPDLYPPDSGRLYRQDSPGHFEDVTEASGLAVPGKSLGVAVWDFDDDGRSDLVVANDTHPNFLFRNLGQGRFEDVGSLAGIAYDRDGKARAGMGIDVGELRPGGPPAIAIGNFSQEALSLYLMEGRSEGFRFQDRAQAAGLNAPSLLPLTFGLMFLDANLDGALDLFLVNGHIDPDIELAGSGLAYAQVPQLFVNRGDGTFQDVTHRSGDLSERPLVGRGLAVGDLDGDGDLDVLISANGGSLTLLRNDQVGGRSLRLSLSQPTANRDALGGIVRVRVGDSWVTRAVGRGGSYLSSSERALTFGLGEHRAGVIEVEWPASDERERFESSDWAEGGWFVLERGGKWTSR